MICLEVKINGSEVCKAGIDHEFGIVCAIIDWVKRDIRSFPKDTPRMFKEEEMKLSISGSATYGKDNSWEFSWLKHKLSVGDEVSIRIVESDVCNPPKSRKKLEPNFVEIAKRRYYEQLKKEYE
jgi:hypothetical protein